MKKYDQGFLLEHLHCVISDETKRQWQYPSISDEYIAILGLTIPCNIIGSWIIKRQKSVFELDNWHIIDRLFKKLYSN